MWFPHGFSLRRGRGHNPPPSLPAALQTCRVKITVWVWRMAIFSWPSFAIFLKKNVFSMGQTAILFKRPGPSPPDFHSHPEPEAFSTAALQSAVRLGCISSVAAVPEGDDHLRSQTWKENMMEWYHYDFSNISYIFIQSGYCLLNNVLLMSVKFRLFKRCAQPLGSCHFQLLFITIIVDDFTSQWTAEVQFGWPLPLSFLSIHIFHICIMYILYNITYIIKCLSWIVS